MKRIIIFFLVLVSFILITDHSGISKAYAVTYTAADLLSGQKEVEIVNKQAPRGCMDVQFGSLSNETAIQLYDCLANMPQKFTIVPISSTAVNIKFKVKCVDVQWSGTANGTLVWLWECNGGAAQVWVPTASGGFRNPNSNRCLEAEAGVNGDWLRIKDCNSSNNRQNWNIVSPTDLAEGTQNIELRSKQYTGKCLDVRNGSTSSGTAIQLQDCSSNENQGFDVVSLTGDSVGPQPLHIKYNGMCLDVSGGGTSNGTPIILNSCRSLSDSLSNAQQWVSYGDGVFRNMRSNRCLYAPNGNNGQQLQIFDCNGQNNQKWSYTTIINPPPTYGRINNLSFGITNLYPWMQVVCGDIRMDNGFNNKQPAGQSAIITNASCSGNPGIIYTGDGTANFGQGQGSSNNRVVGGTSYPEVHSNNGGNGVFSKHEKLKEKARSGDTPITDLSTVCTLSNCTLPVNLPKGIYQANGDVALNSYTFASNQDYVFLIDGNLTIKGNVLTPPASNTSTLFSAAGNINVLPNVGSAPPSTTPHVSGIFSADDSFIIQSNNNCNDLKFNFEGTMIVNADRNGGSLQNLRSLCANDATSPTITFTQRLDFLFSLPEFLKVQRLLSEEAAP